MTAVGGARVPPARRSALRRLAALVLLPALWLVSAVSAAVAARPGTGAQTLAPPEQVIAGLSERLKVLLREERSRLATDRAYLRRTVDELFLPHLDLDGLTRLVLGPYGRQATPSQRAAFIAEFQTLVINTYAHAVQEIGPWEMRFLPLRSAAGQTGGQGPERVTVRTEVHQPRGQPVAVDYRMVQRDGRWLVVDVVVEQVSLLASYRNAFTGIARERGVDGLIRELARRNATAPDT